ncbi:MAG: hypothetical protein CBC46_04840 [Verrucomicrobiaceae bacterium TMED86]|nr:MAG: hypothetical protein CBC46_04840 [Verrucomicrobiaceae bacterium TMED86]
MNWNPEYFNSIGYLGVLLTGGALLLWICYIVKPLRIASLVALGCVVVAFVCARTNSKTHVNRIQPDRSEELAKRAAQEEARKQALLDNRGDEVAQIRFAEDGANDFLDRAGMDDADLKYFESQGGLGEPEWKREKKTRSGGGGDDSLESEIGGEGVIGGVQSDEFDTDESKEPIIMSEADLVMANRLDLLNLKLTLIFLVVGVGVFLFDYLRRANIYGKASRPLPLPSSLLNALTPMAPLVISKKRCRKSARGELARLVKRGDSFIYLTDDSARTAKLPKSMRRLPFVGGKEELIAASAEIDEGFIFETVWYGRSSFVSADPERALMFLTVFQAMLEQRKLSRARVSQTAHLVWDLQSPMPRQTRADLLKLAAATGFSILILREKASKAASHQSELKGEPIPS